MTLLLAACGRIGFDAPGGTGDGGGVDGAVTGALGPRWLARFGPTAYALVATGA